MLKKLFEILLSIVNQAQNGADKAFASDAFNKTMTTLPAVDSKIEQIADLLGSNGFSNVASKFRLVNMGIRIILALFS